MSSFWLRNIGLAVGVAALCSVASGQSFNLDLNIGFGSEAVGNGVPSSAYGAAANQAGFWNNIPAAGGTQSLASLDGAPSNVLLIGPQNGGSGNGYNNPNLFGDFRLLMADGRVVHDDTWTFSGLANGSYLLYTYAVRPSGVITDTRVTVLGATEPTQIVWGPMPANQFALGVTHSMHEISVTNESFGVRVHEGVGNAYVNGFQLVAVPEPATIIFLSMCLGGFLRKRRNS